MYMVFRRTTTLIEWLLHYDRVHGIVFKGKDLQPTGKKNHQGDEAPLSAARPSGPSLTSRHCIQPQLLPSLHHADRLKTCRLPSLLNWAIFVRFPYLLSP